jgi:Protein of unknown function (DUF3667)
MPNCLNCDTDLSSGKFCSNCGQGSTVGRIDGKAMWNEFLRVFMNIDKGLFYTLRQIFTRPGYGALEFVQGKRIRFMRPVTAMAILSAGAKAGVGQFPADLSPWFEVREIPETLATGIFVGAVVSGMFWKRPEFNFWERVILHLFFNMGTMLIIAIGAAMLPGSIFVWLCYCLPVVYAMGMAIAHWQFFGIRNVGDWFRGAAAAGLLTILLLKSLD